MKTPIGDTPCACAHFLFVAALACLCGCTTVIGKGEKETSNIQKNHKTIVLLRALCTNDMPGQELAIRDFTFKLDSWQLARQDGKMELSPAHDLLSQRSLSKSLRDQGWFYVAMDPGGYCLKMTPSGRHSTLQDGFHSSPVFYLSVPADKQLVYAGTVIFHSRPKGVKHTANAPTDYWLAGTLDETEIARKLTGTGLAGLSEIAPRPLVSYDSPAINSDQIVNVDGKHSTSASPAPVVKGDNWSLAGTAGGALAYSGLYVVGASGRGSGDGAACVAAAGAALVLLAVPVALTTAGITAGIHHEKWAKCETALRKQVAEFHIEEKFRQALANQLHVIGTNSTTTPALQLEALPYRIVLRGDEHQQFSLEMAARIRLSNPTDSNPIWEHDYVYCGDAPKRQVDNPYETVVYLWADRHELKEYRGDSGAWLFQHELEQAVEAITDRIKDQLYRENRAGSPAKSIALTEETRPQSPH